MRILDTKSIGTKHFLVLYANTDVLTKPVEVMIAVCVFAKTASPYLVNYMLVDKRADPYADGGIRFGDYKARVVRPHGSNNYTEQFIPVYIGQGKAWRLVYKEDQLTKQMSVRLEPAYYGDEEHGEGELLSEVVREDKEFLYDL